MKHETYATMGARLATLREMLTAYKAAFGAERKSELQVRTENEIRALEDALVGDDPLVLAALRHLRLLYAENDLVLQTEEGPRLVLSGNEHWVLADVAIGDDYGALDFWRPYAIWRNTGALYRVESGGAVADDPFYVPPGSPYTGPVETPTRGGRTG